MARPIVTRLKQEFHPRRLLPSLTAGLVAGILVIIVEVSFAAMIFSGDLAVYVSNGIGFTLFGAFVMGAVVALTGSLPGTVTIPQDSPAAILALVAAAIAGGMPAAATDESTFATIVAAIAATSLLTGIFFLALGLFKLGGLVRYIPYPVVGGFLAGTGWLLVQGGVGVMADASFSLSQLGYLFQSGVWIKWLPGAVFAVLLLLILRRHSHFLIVPSLLLAAVGVFYLLLWVTGVSVTEAGAQGWLLGPFPEGGLWRPLAFSSLGQVNWPAMLGQVSSIGTILIVSVVSLLLNAGGLELTVRRDVDLNRELQAAGVANFVAGLGGSPAGYQALSLSALGHRIGSSSRLVGLFSALLCGAMLFFGASLLSFFPKPVLGGLLVFLGLTFLVEWVYDAWFKLAKVDYLVVLLILGVISTVGVLEGVGLGLILAVILFVVDYSRISVVKHTLSGANYRSNVDRPRLYQQLLRQKGDWLYILELQGFIFFGTAHKLLEQVRQRINAPGLPSPRFVVLDLRQVCGLDASAVLSLIKMKQLAQAQNIVLVFTHLSPQMQRKLEREVFQGQDGAVWRTYPDLDRGVEWCEEQIIQALESVGFSARPKSIMQQLEESLPRTGRFINLLEYLAQEGGEPRRAPTPELIDIASLTDYMERRDVAQGHYLIRQGDDHTGLYFIETGQATAQLEYRDGRTARLRVMGAGTMVGEVSLYSGGRASASVVTDQPSTVYHLSADSLRQMEITAPEVAAAFHKFVAQLLSERLSSTTDTMQALLE